MIPRKPHHKRLQRGKPMKRGTKGIRKIGKVTRKWLDEDRPICVKEWDNATFCALNYEGCWHRNDGYAHSLKRPNRTKPEHDIETVASCSWCHLEKLERMGKEKMAEEVRRVRKLYGLPTYE